MSDLTNQTLHQFLTRRYDLEGLKTLCLYLEVDYDNLDGRTKDLSLIHISEPTRPY